MSRAVDVLLAAEAGWTWLYTAGMPPEPAERRREEIASAGWEYRAWQKKHPTSRICAVFHAGWQFLGGLPADIAWRLQQPDPLLSRKRLDEAAIAALLLFGVFIGFPLAALALFAGPGIARNDDVLEATLICAFAVPMMLLYGLGCVLTLDRWPIASAALGLIGAICLVCCFAWWLPELAVVAAAGGGTAFIAGCRSHRERSAARVERFDRIA